MKSIHYSLMILKKKKYNRGSNEAIAISTKAIVIYKMEFSLDFLPLMQDVGLGLSLWAP